MKKLTKQQQEQQEQVRLALIESNEPLLFDIKDAIEIGIESKKKIEALNKKNADVVEHQRQLCLYDFGKIQDFLGEYKDLVQLYGEDSHISDGLRGTLVLVLVESLAQTKQYLYAIGLREIGGKILTILRPSMAKCTQYIMLNY